MPQEIFEKLYIKVRPSIQKNKGFRDSVSVKKQVAGGLYYLVDQGRMRKAANSFGIEKWTISKQTCFIFTLEKFSLVSIKQKQHNYFANRKLYRTSLFIES